MKYEDTIRRVCGDDWKTVNPDERMGGFGVACVVAYLKGVRPNIEDMARHLNLDVSEIAAPFGRLYRRGAFSSWNLKKDKAILGELSDYEAQIAWCTIAAHAGGFLGV
jgi:hypothetical protein